MTKPWEPFKVKAQSGWDTLPRASKIAACMFPNLVPKSVQEEMGRITHSTEGKRSPLEGKAVRDAAYREQSKTKPTVVKRLGRI
jgi:hypothetical protein